MFAIDGDAQHPLRRIHLNYGASSVNKLKVKDSRNAVRDLKGDDA